MYHSVIVLHAEKLMYVINGLLHNWSNTLHHSYILHLHRLVISSIASHLVHSMYLIECEWHSLAMHSNIFNSFLCSCLLIWTMPRLKRRCQITWTCCASAAVVSIWRTGSWTPCTWTWRLPWCLSFGLDWSPRRGPKCRRKSGPESCCRPSVPCCPGLNHR